MDYSWNTTEYSFETPKFYEVTPEFTPATWGTQYVHNFLHTWATDLLTTGQVVQISSCLSGKKSPE
jgi:hypothetical protein